MGAKAKVLKRRGRRSSNIRNNFGTELVKINGNNGVPSYGGSESEAVPLRPDCSGMAVGQRGSHSEDAPDMAAKRPNSGDKNKIINNNSVRLARESTNAVKESGSEDVLQAASAVMRGAGRKRAKTPQKEDPNSRISVCPSLTDETDLNKTSLTTSDLEFKCIDVFINLFSIASFFFDVGTDIFVAVLYLKGGLYWYFGFTVAFICVPAIINTIFGLIWYVDDHRYYRDTAGTEGHHGKTVSTMRWIIRFLFLVFQIGPILR